MPYGPSSSSSSSGSASFGTLAGVPGDNAALVAALAAKLDKAGGSYYLPGPGGVIPKGRMSVLCATTGKTFTCKTF